MVRCRRGPGGKDRGDPRRHQYRALHRVPFGGQSDPGQVRQASGNAGFDETIATFYEVLPTGKSLGASPAGQAIKTELKNAVASALLSEKTSEKALADAQAAAKRAFDHSGS